MFAKLIRSLYFCKRFGISKEKLSFGVHVRNCWIIMNRKPFEGTDEILKYKSNNKINMC